ncbi:MAG TPA: ABC transporter transmembrane domain-containing protein, partial [Pyrinomonadaceae bacterium]|nr:ABC transporter transmembrane domain-containing protein [Pyrinomonadaceae bacterium]
MDDLRKFARYFLPYKGSLVVGVLCILASTVIGLLIPVFVGRAVDDLGAGPTWAKVTRSALLVIGASVVSGVFLFLQRRILINMSRHVEYDLRQDFY